MDMTNITNKMHKTRQYQIMNILTVKFLGIELMIDQYLPPVLELNSPQFIFPC